MSKNRPRAAEPELPGLEMPSDGSEGRPSLVEVVQSLRERALRREAALLPVRHPNRDFFVCDFVDYAIKDDQASMEAPFFSLATKPDKTQWVWKSKDGAREVTVTPSVLGRATIMDKDVLIYLISQIVAGLNDGREDAGSRRVRFVVYDYLVSTNRKTGGSQYEQLTDALRRLQGTNIETNIKTGDVRVRRGFGLIDEWEVVERDNADERMVAIEVTLSEWLHNAVQAREVLTLSRDYFRLRRPLERRLYELARKHCGQQSFWRVGLDVLHRKTGSRSNDREFWRMLQQIEAHDSLLDYRVECETAPKGGRQVVFRLKQTARHVAELVEQLTLA